MTRLALSKFASRGQSAKIGGESRGFWFWDFFPPTLSPGDVGIKLSPSGDTLEDSLEIVFAN